MTSFGADEPGTRWRTYSSPESRTVREAANSAAATAPSMRSDAGMSRTWWTWARLACGAAILAVLVWRLGTGRPPANASLEGVSRG